MNRFGTVRLALLVLGASALLLAQRGVQFAAPAAHAAAPHPSVQAPHSNMLHASGPNLGGRSYPIRSDIAPPTGLTPPAAAYTGISPGGLRTYGHHPRYPVVPVYAGPIYYGGYGGYPLSLDPPSSPAEGPYPADTGNPDLAAAQDAMAEQIRQLSADLEQLKSSPPPPMVAAPALSQEQSSPQPEQAPIQLVLRSGQQLSVKSYAVMNGMLWDFSGQRVRKVPVADVDIPASTKATEAGGAEFPQLTAQ